MNMKSLTIAEAKAILSPLGIALTKTDGEFKVRVVGSPAGHGYFTTEIDDAVATGRHMAANSQRAVLEQRPTSAERANLIPA